MPLHMWHLFIFISLNWLCSVISISMKRLWQRKQSKDDAEIPQAFEMKLKITVIGLGGLQLGIQL